jgi:hypothetical protein
MSTDARELGSTVVPLPDTLSTCDCPWKPTRHLPSCTVAVAFDSIPLRDRPEFEEGKRFACVSWDLPVQISGTYHIEIEVDPVAIIKDHVDEYQAFEMERGCEEWEKPMAFLCHLVEEQVDIGIFFGNRRQSSDRSYLDELHDQGWTPEDTARLDAALAAVPDPNQGVLEIGPDSQSDRAAAHPREI